MTNHVKDISDAADLIATAREALLNELLPTLAKEQRYVGLMIGNAMAIALRESRSGEDATHGEAMRIRSLLDSTQSGRPEPGTAGEGSELPRLRRALCAAIRAGTFDDVHAPALMAHLVRTASDWVAISNPKALRPEHAPA
jgi:Domain of unknown function (DUF6285)